MTDFEIVPLMYARTLGPVYDLKNMDTLGDLLSHGWRVVRADALPGAAADPPLPPTLVYVLARNEPAASDDDAAVERAAAAMFRLDTNWASDDPTDAEVADRWGGQPDAMRDGYLRRARAALEAAR
ncbi:hypothetical protein [Bifidobacterium adolescentis]|uniref:Uncharacterized protein n=1 Tax=Bifidobacterium adolescentis TaxID=1680 RepID=A0AAF0VH72_BIFAD|nr:hypothetical protein [Bifidobacterium adolescentis]WNE86311.1 hypothetical protein B0703_05240 [Bifidobacterium adolescentis]